MNRKLIITSVLGASCLGAGAMTFTAFAAGPSQPAAIVRQVDTSAPTDSTTDDGAAPADAPSPQSDPSEHLTEVLAPLVTDGTLTQAQADSVIDALQSAHSEGGHGHRGGPGRGGPGRGALALDAAATALGLSAEELATQLRSGSTVAEIATAAGIDVQEVIDSLVAEATASINEKVADGTVTQEQADARLADVETRITERVNNGRPEGGPGGQGPRGHRGPRGGNAPDETPATTQG